MLIFLPPSENKTPATTTETNKFENLSFPQLNNYRKEIYTKLIEISKTPEAKQNLHLGKNSNQEIKRNINLHKEPINQAIKIYTGVLYEALNYASFNETNKQKAEQSILIFSALWGIIKISDKIPAYRLNTKTKLHPKQTINSIWKEALQDTLNQICKEKIILDCRSTPYKNFWKPPNKKLVTTKIVQKIADKEKTISHMAKKTRGKLANHLLTRKQGTPTTLTQLLEASQEKWDTQLIEHKQFWELKILITA